MTRRRQLLAPSDHHLFLPENLHPLSFLESQSSVRIDGHLKEAQQVVATYRAETRTSQDNYLSHGDYSSRLIVIINILTLSCRSQEFTAHGKQKVVFATTVALGWVAAIPYYTFVPSPLTGPNPA